jgi:hypothetical protein
MNKHVLVISIVVRRLWFLNNYFAVIYHFSVVFCLVLILVDSFSRYAQLDKITVFYVLLLVIHLCFIS